MEPRTVEDFLAALQAVVDGAEGRSMPDEEVTRYEELETGLKRAQKTEELVKRTAAYTSTTTPALITGVSRKDDDALERAFDSYVRTGRENADLTELRAQAAGTDAAGGYTVPESFRRKLVERQKAFGGLANEAETLTTASGERVTWPTIDDTANSGVIAAENTAPTSGADLVFGEIVLNAYRYVAPGTGSLPLRVSVELLADSAFDVQALVAERLGRRIARAQAAHFVSGTGTGQPTGITTSTTVTTTYTTAAPSKDELIAAVHDIDPEYREGGNAVWVFSDGTLEQVRKLQDSTGRPLLTDAASSGLGRDPGGVTLLGHRVVIDQGFLNYTDDAVTARYYTAAWDCERDRWVVPIDDLMTTAGLLVAYDQNGDGTFTGSITVYTLAPRNASAEGRPWTELVVDASSTVKPTARADAVRVTGTFGWTSVPDAVMEAAAIQASRMLARRDTPFGLAGSPESGVRLLARLDPDVEVSLAPYRRWWASR